METPSRSEDKSDSGSDKTPKRKVVKVLRKANYVGSPPSEDKNSSVEKTGEKIGDHSEKTKAERVKGIISNVQGQKRKLEEIEVDQEKIEKKIKKIKKEVNDWMKKTNKEKIVWNSRAFHTFSCAPLKRTEASDILEMVERMYGTETLEKVINELDRLHTAKYDGQYDVRFITNEEKEKRSRKKKKASDTKTSKKKKRALIL